MFSIATEADGKMLFSAVCVVWQISVQIFHIIVVFKQFGYQIKQNAKGLGMENVVDAKRKHMLPRTAYIVLRTAYIVLRERNR